MSSSLSSPVGLHGERLEWRRIARDELAAIEAAIADTLAGFGRFGVVEGSAGIGKSSILSEGRAQAAGAGMTVLSAHGTEIERSFSYGVVRQLFERLVAQSDETGRSRLLEGAAAHAGWLFSAEQLPGLYWLALNLAEERPLLIFIDDLQWADEASVRWVAYLQIDLGGTPPRRCHFPFLQAHRHGANLLGAWAAGKHRGSWRG